MKRLRPRCFEKIMFEEAQQLKSKNYCEIKTERLRRLIWCYNKYYFNTLSNSNLFLHHTLSTYCIKIRHENPNVWLPEIRTE